MGNNNEKVKGVNQSKRLRLIIIFVLLNFLLFSCNKSLQLSNSSDSRLATQAIFKYLEQPNIFIKNLTQKGKVQIDPLLACRGRLGMNGKLYFEDSIWLNLLKDPLPSKTGRLFIPDSLFYKYQYSADTDYEHDYALIFQFSPLLPTSEADVYVMEHYVWGSSCDEEFCVRILSRNYLKFKIRKKEIEVLDEQSANNDVDFLGLVGFLRQDLEQAQPGEKIKKWDRMDIRLGSGHGPSDVPKN